ncbi:MAG: antitoxin [Chloroflexi bacterium]|nr:antitoxin [Chloroflexota bacterium]
MLHSFERGEWRPMPALREKLAAYQAFASADLEARGLVSVHLPEQDLKAIRRKAADAGVPHQTLISSIVHDFVAGQLVKPHS